MPRTVTRSLLSVAVLAGVATGVVAAVAGGDGPGPPPTATTVEIPQATGPLRTSLPGVLPPAGAADRLPVTYPHHAGTGARVVTRIDDPYGGPPWAVRTFRRTVRLRDAQGVAAVRQTCAQVGRMVGGRFVWIAPHRPVAYAVPVDTTDTTVCTGRSRGVVLGALRLPAGEVGASNPEIAATVIWGLSPRRGTTAGLRSAGGSLELPEHADGTRLLVVRGDLDVGRRTVVADGRPVRYGLEGSWSAGPSVPGPRRAARKPEHNISLTAGLRVAAVVADPSADHPRLIAVGAGPATGVPCYAVLGALVAGEPVRVVAKLGALAPSTALCMTVGRIPAGRWTSLNGGSSSQSEQVSTERRRGREYRTLAGTSNQAWAFPPDVAEVDVEDPLGVRTIRTVRVGDASVAVVQRAGDLPTGPSDFERDRRRIFTGRDDHGHRVTMRYAPIVP